MASLATALAMQNDKVTVDIVESNEFPHLSQRYGIRGVPTTIIDDSLQVVGAVPARSFLDSLKEHLAGTGQPEPPQPASA